MIPLETRERADDVALGLVLVAFGSIVTVSGCRERRYCFFLPQTVDGDAAIDWPQPGLRAGATQGASEHREPISALRPAGGDKHPL